MTEEEAVNKVIDLHERNRPVPKDVLITAKLCLSCEGTGEIYDDDRDADVRCAACGGDGLAKSNPAKGR